MAGTATRLAAPFAGLFLIGDGGFEWDHLVRHLREFGVVSGTSFWIGGVLRRFFGVHFLGDHWSKL